MSLRGGVQLSYRIRQKLRWNNGVDRAWISLRCLVRAGVCAPQRYTNTPKNAISDAKLWPNLVHFHNVPNLGWVGVPLGCIYLKLFWGRLSMDDRPEGKCHGCWYKPLKKSLPNLTKISMFYAISLRKLGTTDFGGKKPCISSGPTFL